MADETVETTEQVDNVEATQSSDFDLESMVMEETTEDTQEETQETEDATDNDTPVEAETEETVAETEQPATEYDIESDSRYQTLLEKARQAEQLQSVVFSNDDIFQQIVTKIQEQEQGTQPQTVKKQESLQITMPDVPQYFNTEDLNDKNSDSYKWFLNYGQTIAENARNATMQEADQLFDKKFEQKERLRAESEQRVKLQNAVIAAKQEVGADDTKWNNFIGWFNDPNKDVTQMLPTAYRLYEAMNGNGKNTPTLEVKKNVTTTPKPVNRQQSGSTLPTYSQIGGETSAAESMTEDEFLAKSLFDSLKDTGRRKR